MTKKLAVIITLLLLTSCGPIPGPKPPQPPPSYGIAAVVTNSTSGSPIIGAACQTANLPIGLTNGDGYYFFGSVPSGSQAMTCTAKGYVSLSVPYESDDNKNVAMPMVVAIPPLPPAPTRDQILSAQETFQGLMVTTDCGAFPYYGGVYSSPDLTADCRQQLRQQLRAEGDTIIGLTVSWNYCGQSYGYCYPLGGRDLAYDLDTLVALAREIVADGFYVHLREAGDGMSVNPNPQQGQYNDPVGWTYGYEWLMTHHSSIRQAFTAAGLQGHTVFNPGYDGVVPGWPEPTYRYPGKLDKWLLNARSDCGDCYLGVELSAGYAHWGCESACYSTDAGKALDAIYQEFNSGPYETGDMDQVWQIAARHLGPAYVRGPGQAASDDPGAPFGPHAGQFYLRDGTPRGPYFVNALEFDTYLWVRNRISVQDVQKDATYLRRRGYTIVGYKEAP